MTENAQAHNRRLFLTALRSGDYPKGPIETDDMGRPLDPNAKGWCAVGLAFILFCEEQKGFKQKMGKALGLTSFQITFIQQEWNDSHLTFHEIADLIESRMFTRSPLGTQRTRIHDDNGPGY